MRRDAPMRSRGRFTNISRTLEIGVSQKSHFLQTFWSWNLVCVPISHALGTIQSSNSNSHHKCDFWHGIFSRDYFGELSRNVSITLPVIVKLAVGSGKLTEHAERQNGLFLPPSWRHAHAHFGFAHRQQPLRWLKPFLKHWYVKLYELIAPHTLKWINSVIKLGHFVLNIIYCLSRIKFKDRWVVFFIYDSFCWTKSPTAASLGSRNDAM